MTNSLEKIAAKADGTAEYAVSSGLKELDLRGVRHPVLSIEPFGVKAKNSAGRKLLLSGETTAELILPCDRCLADVSVTVPVSVDLSFPITDGQVRNDPDDPVFGFNEEEQTLEWDEVLSALILTGIPTKVLCREDCRGLCPVCGADLNLGECGCERKTLDPRMQQFLDVFREASI